MNRCQGEIGLDDHDRALGPGRAHPADAIDDPRTPGRPVEDHLTGARPRFTQERAVAAPIGRKGALEVEARQVAVGPGHVPAVGAAGRQIDSPGSGFVAATARVGRAHLGDPPPGLDRQARGIDPREHAFRVEPRLARDLPDERLETPRGRDRDAPADGDRGPRAAPPNRETRSPNPPTRARGARGRSARANRRRRPRTQPWRRRCARRGARPTRARPAAAYRAAPARPPARAGSINTSANRRLIGRPPWARIVRA